MDADSPPTPAVVSLTDPVARQDTAPVAEVTDEMREIEVAFEAHLAEGFDALFTHLDPGTRVADLNSTTDRWQMGRRRVAFRRPGGGRHSSDEVFEIYSLWERRSSRSSSCRGEFVLTREEPFYQLLSVTGPWSLPDNMEEIR